MNLIAHVTPLEGVGAVIVFLTGACAGLLMARSVYLWLKERAS